MGCPPSVPTLELCFERLLVGVLYIGLIYQVEHIGPVGALAYKLYALALLRPHPPRLGAKLPPFGPFIGLKKFVVPIAIVEDLGTGL